MGIRAALGASAFVLLGLVVRRGLMLTVTGLAIGIAGATVMTRVLTSIFV
jgi:hypothetical protein